MARAAFISPADIRPLTRRSDLWGWALTLHCWGVIALAMWATVLVPWLFPLAFVLIGSRQLGLSILMHEAAHNTLFDTRALNDRVGHWLLSVPWGGDLHAYRGYHLKHHANTQTDDDPDLHLSAKFPTTRASMARKFTRDLTGLTGIKLRAYQLATLFKPGHPLRASTAAFVAVNALAFAAFAAAGLWWVFVGLWLAPLLTWYQFVLRLRNIAEHAVTTRDGNVLTTARTTRTNWLTRALVAPYWVNYHVEHHAYMYVPCYRLKNAHAKMRAGGYAMEYKPGYRAVLKAATVSPSPIP